MSSRFSICIASFPNTYPAAAPTMNWMAKEPRMEPMPMPELPTSCISTTVSMYAMGSLLPLSSSNIGLKLCLRFIFCERRIANTEAESVEDMVAASSREVTKGRVMLVQLIPESHQMKSPVNSAVRNTPTVESMMPE